MRRMTSLPEPSVLSSGRVSPDTDVASASSSSSTNEPPHSPHTGPPTPLGGRYGRRDVNAALLAASLQHGAAMRQALWDSNGDVDPARGPSGQLDVLDPLLNVFTFLPADRPTIVAVSHVSAAWRAGSARLPQWEVVGHAAPSPRWDRDRVECLAFRGRMSMTFLAGLESCNSRDEFFRILRARGVCRQRWLAAVAAGTEVPPVRATSDTLFELDIETATPMDTSGQATLNRARLQAIERQAALVDAHGSRLMDRLAIDTTGTAVGHRKAAAARAAGPQEGPPSVQLPSPLIGVAFAAVLILFIVLMATR